MPISEPDPRTITFCPANRALPCTGGEPMSWPIHRAPIAAPTGAASFNWRLRISGRETFTAGPFEGVTVIWSPEERRTSPWYDFPSSVCTTPACATALRMKMIATNRKDNFSPKEFSALVQRQIVIRHRQNHRVNRGAIDRPDAAPAVPARLPVNHVALLPRRAQQQRLDLVVICLPRLAADHVHRGGGVEIAVGEPLTLVAVLKKKIRAGGDLRIVILPANLQRINRRGRSRV